MGKSFAQRIMDAQKEYFMGGQRTGEQFAADCMAVSAQRLGISRPMIVKLTAEMISVAHEYADMFDVRNAEADVYQEHMDDVLRGIYGKAFVPWNERYEYMKSCKY